MARVRPVIDARRIRAAVAVVLLIVAAGASATGRRSAYDVELSDALRLLANHGRPSPVTHAAVTIDWPDEVDAQGVTPVLFVSATADAGASSSRRLAEAYADVANAADWIVVAADAAEPVPPEEDDVPLRIALDLAALATLERERPSAVPRAIAFGGISGGAKFAGWLAAAFARQGHRVLGVYQAGINEDTLVDAATRFDVLDASFRAIRVFLQSGRQDEVATPVDHRAVADKLRHAGFRDVRIVYFAGGHVVYPAPLGDALRWFAERPATPPPD